MTATLAEKPGKQSEVKPIPDGFHTVTPHLTVRGGVAAIEFYKKAFGAEEMFRAPIPQDPSKVMHAQVRIGDSIVMLADEFPGCNQSPASLGGSGMNVHLYVRDTDALFARAEKAGAKVIMPPMDMFWGDRYAVLEDPFGHRWSIATHQRDVSPEDIATAGAACMAEAAKHAK
jgi:PhnB protein